MRRGTLGALIGALAQAASAQIDANALDRQNQLIERQQQELLRIDQESARRAPSTQPGADLRDVRPQVNVPDIGVPCRDIRSVRIDGAEHLPADVARRVETAFSGRCLGVGELEAVLAQITKSYIDRGFITTRAYLPAQDLRTGTLRISVIEGRIEGYRVDGPRDASVWPRGVFPATPGDLLNLRDLEQGIDQINRLASSRAVLDIQPGSRPGDSVVVVKNPSVPPVNLYASVDNYGTRATGRESASATVSFDSVLGLNEMFSFTRRATVPHDADHDASINAMQFSIPFGYSTLSLDNSQSRYANRLTLPSGATLLSTGVTTTRSAALDRVVYRDQASRVSLSGRLSTQETESYLGGQFLGIASRKLAYGDIGLSGFTAVAGGLGNARLGYVQGISGFGALRDAADLPDDAPHAQFRKLVVDVGFNRRFEIAKQPLLWSSQFSGQHARDTLYGSQQFLIGGVSSVRGALASTLSGDDGYLLRNELSLPWQMPGDGTTLGGRVYVAYDVGHVRNRAPGVPSGSLSGATVGTTLTWKRTSLDLFAARALHVPSPLVRESTQFGFRLSVSL